METASPQRMTIIILGAVLLAAVAVGAVIFFTPTLNPQPQEIAELEQTESDVVAELAEPAPQSSGGSDVGFNTAVLTQPKYKALDASLFTRGFLPVQPPATAGKQNPFQ